MARAPIMRVTMPRPASGGGGARSLITWAEIAGSHQGTFAMPEAFAYSEGMHAQLSDGRIAMVGHVQDQDMAIASLPGTLNGAEATGVGSFVDLSNGSLPTGWAGGDAYRFGGLLELGSRLYYSKHQWYNASGGDWDAIGYNTNVATWSAANANGMWDLTGTGVHSQRSAGYLNYAPEAVIADGYHFLAGQQGQSGNANGRWGPNLFAVKVDNGIAAPGPWLSKPLIWHDEAHPAADWWIANKAFGMWIETDNRHGVLFIVCHDYPGADTWYGTAEDAPPGASDPYDPEDVTSEYHASGWGVSAWLYDPADLMEVYNGTANGYSLTPYEVTPLISRAPGSGTETHHSVFPGNARQDFRMSLRDGRLIVARPGGYDVSAFDTTPAGHVFNLNAIT